MTRALREIQIYIISLHWWAKINHERKLSIFHLPFSHPIRIIWWSRINLILIFIRETIFSNHPSVLVPNWILSVQKSPLLPRKKVHLFNCVNVFCWRALAWPRDQERNQIFSVKAYFNFNLKTFFPISRCRSSLSQQGNVRHRYRSAKSRHWSMSTEE